MNKEPKRQRIRRPNRRDAHMKLKLIIAKNKKSLDYEMVLPESTALADETLIKTDWMNKISEYVPPTEKELRRDTAYFNRIYACLKNLKL